MPPVHISGPQCLRLRDVLVAIYQNHNDFAEQLANVDKFYDTLSVAALTYRQNVFVIIRTAATEGWLVRLIDQILGETSDPGLLQIKAELATLANVPAGTDPFEVCRLTGTNVLVDRSNLRVALRGLEHPQGRRILVIKGPRKSGKSHTVHFISYLEEVRGHFTLIHLNLENFRWRNSWGIRDASNTSPIRIVTTTDPGLMTGARVEVDGVEGNTGANGVWTLTFRGAGAYDLNGSTGTREYVKGGVLREVDLLPVDAWDIAKRLVDLMAYDFRLADRPTDGQWSRWVLDFCDRFEARGRGQEQQHWIVMDAFGSALLSQSALDLIKEIANRVNLTLRRFRLILIGFQDSLPGQVVPHLEEEEIGQIGEAEIIDFFVKALIQMNVKLSEDELVEVVTQVLEEADPKDPNFLEKLGTAINKALFNLSKRGA